MIYVEILYLVVFTCWLVITLVWQFPAFRTRNTLVSRINRYLKLWPIWTFFAPNPGMFDIHVLYRDVDEDSKLSKWSEVNIIVERKPHHIIWNPHKRYTKLIVDAVSYINGETDPGSIPFSKGYLVLLNLVISERKLLEKPIARQFSVVKSGYLNGEKEIFPIYRSAFHEF